MALHCALVVHSPPGPPDVDELLEELELLELELEELDEPPATTLAHWSLVVPC